MPLRCWPPFVVFLCTAVMGGWAVAPAHAADCSPGGLPGGSTVLLSTADALVWQTAARSENDFDTTAFGCAVPGGDPRQVYQIAGDGTSNVDGLRSSGTRVAYVFRAHGGIHNTVVLDLRSGRTEILDLDGAFVLGTDGTAAGPGFWTPGLLLSRPDSAKQVIVDLATTATDVALTPGWLRFTQSGTQFSVDTSASRLPLPPRSPAPCALLTKAQAAAAGGEGAGHAPFASHDPQPICEWGELTLQVRPPLSASGQRALVGSAQAAGLRRVKLPGSTAFTLVTGGALSGRVRTLAVIHRGTLLRVSLRAGGSSDVSRLRTAAVHALRALGWKR